MVDMQYISLIRVRDTLGLSAFEAAHYFGNSDITTWMKWESNQIVTPSSVTDRVDAAMTRYKRFCETVSTTLRKGSPIKEAYRELTAILSATAEHQILEHKIAQRALESVLRETQAFAL